MNPLQTLLDSLGAEWQSLVQALPRFGLAALVLVLAYLLGGLVGRALDHVLSRGSFTSTHRSFFRRLARWLVLLVGVSVALDVLGLSGVATGLLAGGGLTAVVLGFAFRGIGENLLAGVFLAFSRPFDVDDLIESGDFQGNVKAIELRYTHIRTFDGWDVFVPNAKIFNEPLVNYTRDDLLRHTFKLGIDFRDDVAAACAVIKRTLDETHGVLDRPKSAARASRFADNWLEIEVTYWVRAAPDAPPVLDVRSSVIDRCRSALLDAGVTLSGEVSSNLHVTVDAPPSA